MNNTYYTADLHFGHSRLVEQRGFSSVEEMNNGIIEKWNAKITKKDIVYCLGDFSFTNGEETNRILDKLNYAAIHYLRGNHENYLNKFQHRFETVNDLKEIKIPYNGSGNYGGNISITLCHYAMKRWNKSHYGSWHFFGHSHSELKDPEPFSMDVGVDTRKDLSPYSFEEIAEIFEKQAQKQFELKAAKEWYPFESIQ